MLFNLGKTVEENSRTHFNIYTEGGALSFARIGTRFPGPVVAAEPFSSGPDAFQCRKWSLYGNKRLTNLPARVLPAAFFLEWNCTATSLVDGAISSAPAR